MASSVYSGCVLTAVLCGLLIASSLQGSNGAVNDHFNDEHRLYTYLMKNYHVGTRPSKLPQDPVTISVGFDNPRIETLDTAHDTLTMSVWLSMNWKDPRLAWNEEDYGNVSAINIPATEVWKPDIVIYNTSPYAPTQQTDVLASVSSTGNIYHIPDWTISGYCGLDLKDFPYDTQTCKIVMGSWTYSGKKVLLAFPYTTDKVKEIAIEDPSVHYTVNNHPQWEMIGLRAEIFHNKYPCCPEVYPSVTLEVKLKRRPSYYNYVLIGPAVLVSFLVPVLFLLPVDSTYKSNFGITLLLTTTVMILVLQDAVAFNHASVPKIAVFYFTTMILEVISIFLSTIVIWVAGKGKQKRPLPQWLDTMCLSNRVTRRLLCMDVYSPVNTMASTMNMRLLEETSDASDPYLHQQAELHDVDMMSHQGGQGDVANKILAKKVLSESAYEKLSHEWLEIARFLDRLFFVAFFAMFIITTLSFLA